MGSIVSEDKPKISYGLSENNNQNTDEYHVEKDNILFQPNREA
jgi:hypothetical protein